MSSGGGQEEAERGHRARNSELRRSISDMNLSLRRRQGNHISKDPSGPGNRPNNDNGGVQDRKNIVSMINPQPGQVQGQTFPFASRVLNFTPHCSFDFLFV